MAWQSLYEDVDMFTTVVVGNSNTYLHRGFMITPRGYEGKTNET